MTTLTLGMIGLDSSHTIAFSNILNDTTHPHHVAGGKVKYAYQGGSPNLALSMDRIVTFTEQMKTEHQVEVLETIEAVMEKSDAVFLESVDGGQHLEQFKQMVTFQKPIFIDKPFTLHTKDAQEIIDLAKKHDTPIMSSSALRFSEGLTKALQVTDKGDIIGVDCFGPMEIIADQPGYFWYGIHTVEMLFTVLGGGYQTISIAHNNDYDVITAVWNNGKIGTIRGNRRGNFEFGALVHFEKGQEFVQVATDETPFYASLLKSVMQFFQTGKSVVPIKETYEIIRFMEEANALRIKISSES